MYPGSFQINTGENRDRLFFPFRSKYVGKSDKKNRLE